MARDRIEVGFAEVVNVFQFSFSPSSIVLLI
jgi:hypothetical protein